jgi:hypothetical protein
LTNWKVTFERSNGTQGSDTFTANTAKEAKHDFFECYRHDTYKIISVKEINSDQKIKTYRAEFEDDEIEIFTADTDSQAINEAFKMEEEHGTLWNLHSLDENYNEIKTVF